MYRVYINCLEHLGCFFREVREGNEFYNVLQNNGIGKGKIQWVTYKSASQEFSLPQARNYVTHCN